MAQVFSDIFYAIPRQPEITLVRFFFFFDVVLLGFGA